MNCSFCKGYFELASPSIIAIGEDKCVLEIDSCNCVFCRKGVCGECAELAHANTEFDNCVLARSEDESEDIRNGLSVTAFRRRLKICPDCLTRRGSVLPERFDFDNPPKIRSMICRNCLSGGTLHSHDDLTTCFGCCNLLCIHDSLVLIQGNAVAHFCSVCFNHFLANSPECSVCKNKVFPYQERSFTDYRGFKGEFLAFDGEARIKTCHVCKKNCCQSCCSLIKEKGSFVKNAQGEYANICHSCSEKKSAGCNSRIMPYEEYEKMIEQKRIDKEANDRKKFSENVKIVRFANAQEEEEWYREHDPWSVTRQHDEKGAWAYQDDRATAYESRPLLHKLKEYFSRLVDIFKK